MNERSSPNRPMKIAIQLVRKGNKIHREDVRHKLDNMEKSTGSPSCPPEVCTTKPIVLDVVGRTTAGIIGYTSKKNFLNDGVEQWTH